MKPRGRRNNSRGPIRAETRVLQIVRRHDRAHDGIVVHAPSEVVKDPQLRENDIVVPIEGAGEKVKFTVSSPLTVHNVPKVAARRAPAVGEHNDELLQELGFSSDEIARFRTGGAIPHAAHEAEVLGGVR